MSEIHAIADRAPGGIGSQVWKVAAVAMLGPFMTGLDATVVNVSLPAVQQALHAQISSIQWIVSGYLLAMALMLPLNGWLVDRLGAKRLYIYCFTAFTLASLLCGSARTVVTLIVGRVLQGMAGGLLAPMAQMMIARVAERHMTRVMGYAAAPVLIAPILGPVAAGTILKYASWSWIFYLNLPFGILAVASAALLLPDDRTVHPKRPFDTFGFLTIAPGLVFFLSGLERFKHEDGKLTLATGSILTGTFILHALRKGSAALIDLRLFKNPILSAAAATQFLSNGQAYAGQFLISLFLISGCGLTAAQAGWTIACSGAGMMCSFPMIGFLTERFGFRAISATGAFLALSGMLPFLWMIASGFSPIVAGAGLFFRGLGQGAIGIPSLSAAYASVPQEKLAVANTAINIIQRLGGPVATTIAALSIAPAAASLHVSSPHAFGIAFSILITLHILALASASRLPVHIDRHG